MTKQVDITEHLSIDLAKERWCCRRCRHDLGPARLTGRRLAADRDPRESTSSVEETTSPDPEWARIVEFYCPGCAGLIEVEYLPPGHPITHDIELDIDALKAKHGS